MVKIGNPGQRIQRTWNTISTCPNREAMTITEIASCKNKNRVSVVSQLRQLKAVISQIIKNKLWKIQKKKLLPTNKKSKNKHFKRGQPPQMPQRKLMLQAETKRNPNTTAKPTNLQANQEKPPEQVKALELIIPKPPAPTPLQRARRSWLLEMISLLSMSPAWWKCSVPIKLEKRIYQLISNRKLKSSSRIMFGTHKTRTKMPRKLISPLAALKSGLKTDSMRCLNDEDAS